jgi:hypothetical protein
LIVALTLCGCDGGGGGGGVVGIGPGTPTLSSIAADPGGVLLWDATNLAPAAPPVLKLNSVLVFNFGGELNPGAPGALTSTLLRDPSGGVPFGSFSVQDDPTLPAGNRRRLVFTPVFLGPTAAVPCASPYVAGATYTINLPAGAFGVAGEPLQNGAAASFVATPCPTGDGSSPYADPSPGAAFVASSTPALADPAGPAAPAGSIVANRLSIVINEPLNPATVDAASITVHDAVSGAVFPGTTTFQQAAGTWISGPSTLEFFAAAPFPDGRTFEATLSSALRDLGGNPVETSPANDPGLDGIHGTSDDGPKARLLFATAAVPLTPQSIVESFDDVARRAAAGGLVTWTGAGSVVFGDAVVALGDGSEGPFTAPPGRTDLNTDETIVVGGLPKSRRGVWNFSSLVVPAGSTLRFYGPWPVHLRVRGTAQIDGALNLNAGSTSPTSVPPPLPYDAGPRNGQLNNPVAIPVVAGGAASSGAGAGGKASNVNTGTPPHCVAGDPGDGPSVDGLPGIDPLHPTFAGGEGGRSGFLPPSFPGEPAGLGGAGGTAATGGEVGQPRTPFPACAPLTVVGTVALAQPHTVTIGFVPPIQSQSAGSGGGGGGDKKEITNPPQNDDQGGGGGGGGGGLRLSCLDNLNLSGTAQVFCNGMFGGTGATLAGHGGSGSGGQVWLESFASVLPTATTMVQVIGPARVGGSTTTTGCSQQAAGGGGQGLIQLEAAVGTPGPLASSAGAVVQTVASANAVTWGGEVLSTWIDTGTFAPTWTSAVETVVLGALAGASLVVEYEGAHAGADGATPDLSTLKSTTTGAPGGPPITAATITALNDFRFIRFRVRGSIGAAPGAVIPEADLPRLESVVLNFGAP